MKKLNAARIPHLPPGRYHDGRGLYLFVGKGGARSWVFRFRKNGKLRDHGLGPVHKIPLAEARVRADRYRVAVYDGKNPIDARKAERIERKAESSKPTSTFAAAADDYITGKAPGWTDPRQEQQWRNSLVTHAFPVLGPLAVREITVDDVESVLRPIWVTTYETATRVRGRIEKILGWATGKGFREGPNPAVWKDNLSLRFAKIAKPHDNHHVALPYTETAQFMAELRQQDGIDCRAFEIAILTASRTDEVISGEPDEVDLDRRFWTRPAPHMKLRQEHRVPLSDAALEIFKTAAASRGAEATHLFPGNSRGKRAGMLGPQAFRRVLEKMGRSDLDPHGFRSSFSDWAHEETDYSHEMIEVALAHKVGTDVARRYWRGDMMKKRLQLMEDWARYCAGGANVVPLPGRFTA
jgi:integrase